MDDVDFEDGKLFYEFHVNALLERVRTEFDGPIYRGEEDLETVRNSQSTTVAVVAEDRPMVFYVSREKVLRGEINLNAWDLFEHAAMPPSLG